MQEYNISVVKSRFEEAKFSIRKVMLEMDLIEYTTFNKNTNNNLFQIPKTLAENTNLLKIFKTKYHNILNYNRRDAWEIIKKNIEHDTNFKWKKIIDHIQVLSSIFWAFWQEKLYFWKNDKKSTNLRVSSKCAKRKSLFWSKHI